MLCSDIIGAEGLGLRVVVGRDWGTLGIHKFNWEMIGNVLGMIWNRRSQELKVTMQTVEGCSRATSVQKLQ